MVARDPRVQLRADARWHRSQAEQLAKELDKMTPDHAAAIGEKAVRQYGGFTSTTTPTLQLAEEIEAYLENGLDLVEDQHQHELF